jgi:excisionase family DNA binding protein
MPKESRERLLPTSEAAELLGVTDQTLRNWAEAGRIRHIRMPSGQIRFRRQDIDAVLEPVEPVDPSRAS